MSLALEKIADQVAHARGKTKGAISVSAVAIAYVLQKLPYVFPIIGGKKVEQLIQKYRGVAYRTE